MIALLLIISLCIAYWIHFYLKQKSLPPGPWGIPIYGYWPFLRGKLNVQLRQLSKKYGDLFSIQVGNRLAVVMNNYELIRQAYLKQGLDVDGRPESELFASDEPPTLFYSESDSWVMYRRFGVSTLRDFHMSKTSLEPVIMSEYETFFEKIKQLNGKPTDFRVLTSKCLYNITTMFSFGKRFEYEDKSYEKLIDLGMEFISLFETLTKDCHKPFQMRLVRKFFGITEHYKEKNDWAFVLGLKKLIDAELSKSSSCDEQLFHHLWKSEGEKKNGTNKDLSSHGLARFISSIYVGTEAVTISVMWTFLYMLANPEVIENIQKEIDEVLGQDQIPSYNDRLRMPYTEATLHELHRHISLTPVIIPHLNRHEFTFEGYRIPARSSFLANVWAVNFDPANYSEPEKFKPERFLDKNGKVFTSPFLTPFSLGRRLCPGEVLARMEMFLLLTSLLQKFNIRKPEETVLNFEPSMPVLVRLPHSHKIIIEPRFKTE